MLCTKTLLKVLYKAFLFKKYFWQMKFWKKYWQTFLAKDYFVKKTPKFPFKTSLFRPNYKTFKTAPKLSSPELPRTGPSPRTPAPATGTGRTLRPPRRPPSSGTRAPGRTRGRCAQGRTRWAKRGGNRFIIQMRRRQQQSIGQAGETRGRRGLGSTHKNAGWAEPSPTLTRPEPEKIDPKSWPTS